MQTLSILSAVCDLVCRKSHKASCTRLAQQHLRVNVSLSSGKKGDGGSSNSVLDLGKAHHADNLRGIPVSRGAPVREVEPCINVRHNKLFSVKIQVQAGDVTKDCFMSRAMSLCCSVNMQAAIVLCQLMLPWLT